MARGRSTTRRRKKSRDFQQHQDTVSNYPIPSTHTSCQASSASSSPDDDLSLWMPPKAKDRNGTEAEELPPQAKQETRKKISAVLHSMDLIADGRGFLLPRKAKSKKDERTVHNEPYDSSSSEDEWSSEDSSSQEEGISGRKKHDTMSAVPYGLLVQDDADIHQHPKTPSMSSRRGMASFSTLTTEAMTLTPASGRNSSSFQASSINAFQSPPPPRGYIPANFDFVNNLISPLLDEPTFTRASTEEVVIVSSPHMTTKESHDSATTSNQRRAPYSSPVISKSHIVRSNRHLNRRAQSESMAQVFPSPQSRTQCRRRRIVQQENSVMSEESTTKNVAQRSGTGHPKRENQQHHVQPHNVEELVQSTSTMMLHPTSTPIKTTIVAMSNKMEHETSGRSRGTLSTEGTTLISSTGRETAHSDPNRVEHRYGGEPRRDTSLLKEHLEFYSPSKSVFRPPLRIPPRVDADGFPMWSLDDDQAFPVWGLDDQPHRHGTGSYDTMDSLSLCSEAGAVIIATRKVLVVKEKRGRTKSRDEHQQQSWKNSFGS